MSDAVIVLMTRSFTGSKLVFEVDLEVGEYWLGPAASFAIDRGRRVAAEFGPLPEESLAGFSSFVEAPGWAIALGSLTGPTDHVEAFGEVAARAGHGPARVESNSWQPLASCVFGGRWWAAEMRVEHVRLKLVDGARVHQWTRGTRSYPPIE